MCRGDERAEQRMRLQRFRFELGMKLAAEIPRMVCDLADLDVGAVGRLAGDPQARSRQDRLKFAIELEAMAMALANGRRAIRLAREAVLFQNAGPGAQAHSSAQLINALQFPKFIDHAMRRSRVELGGIGGLESAD